MGRMSGHRTTTATTLHYGADGQRTDDDDGMNDETEGRTLGDNGDVTDAICMRDTRAIAPMSLYVLYVFVYFISV